MLSLDLPEKGKTSRRAPLFWWAHVMRRGLWRWWYFLVVAVAGESTPSGYLDILRLHSDCCTDVLIYNLMVLICLDDLLPPHHLGVDFRVIGFSFLYMQFIIHCCHAVGGMFWASDGQFRLFFLWWPCVCLCLSCSHGLGMQKIVTDNCKNSRVQILVYGPDPRIRHETFCIYLYMVYCL